MPVSSQHWPGCILCWEYHATYKRGGTDEQISSQAACFCIALCVLMQASVVAANEGVYFNIAGGLGGGGGRL